MNNKQLEIIKSITNFGLGKDQACEVMDIWAKEFLKWFNKRDADSVPLLDDDLFFSSEDKIDALYQQFLNDTK